MSDEQDWDDILTVSKQKVGERFMSWLEANHPDRAKDWQRKREAQPEPFAAEAVIWETVTRRFGATIEVADEHGGPDFKCVKDGFTFFVEVASLDSESVAKRTGLPNDWEPGARSFGFDHVKVRDVVKKKRKQLGNQPHPVVLAVCCEHARSSLLFNELGCREMMFGTLGFSIPLGQESPVVRDIAKFKDSVWLEEKADGSGVELKSNNPSAIILVSVYERWCEVTGLLHPSPDKAFPYQLFDGVPFRRFVEWPPTDHVELEWVIEKPQAKRVSYVIDFKE